MSLTDSIPTNDLVLILLFSRVSPDQPFDQWSSIAAEFYDLSRVLISADDVEFLYTKTIEKHGSYQAAQQAVAELKQTWKKHAQSKVKRLIPLATTSATSSKLHLASSSTSPADGTNVELGTTGNHALSSQRRLSSSPVPVERLLHTVELFRVVEGYIEFDEPVNGRIRHLISPSASYSAVVKQPMSLSMLRADIQKGIIHSWVQLEAALWLMAANCVMFNPPEGPYPSLARRFVSNCMEIVGREAATSSL